jgi:hypothetical protein
MQFLSDSDVLFEFPVVEVWDSFKKEQNSRNVVVRKCPSWDFGVLESAAARYFVMRSFGSSRRVLNLRFALGVIEARIIWVAGVISVAKRAVKGCSEVPMVVFGWLFRVSSRKFGSANLYSEFTFLSMI